MSDVFETFDYEPAYEIEIDPEFPGRGDWPAPAYWFDDTSVSLTRLESRWGSPLVIRVAVGDGRWTGTFTGGGVGPFDGVFATPDPRRVLCVVRGMAYVVDVDNPTAVQISPTDRPTALFE